MEPIDVPDPSIIPWLIHVLEYICVMLLDVILNLSRLV